MEEKAKIKIVIKQVVLSSPAILQFGEDIIIAQAGHKMFSKEHMGIKMPIFYDVLTTGKEGEKFEIDIEILFNEEPIGIIASIQELIASCAQMGERLLDKLLSVNEAFANTGLVSGEIKALEEEKGKPFTQFDFEMNRQLLSSILKSKQFDWLDEIRTIYNIKNYSATLCQFIKDRNKYTHGHLLYWFQNKLTVLKYKEGGEIEYGQVNSDIIKSYVECFLVLDEFLSLLFEKLNPKPD